MCVRVSAEKGRTTVAVVADPWWHPKSAQDAMPIVWDEGPNAKQSSATIAERLKEGLTSSENQFAYTDVGDAPKAIPGAAGAVPPPVVTSRRRAGWVSAGRA